MSGIDLLRNVAGAEGRTIVEPCMVPEGVVLGPQKQPRSITGMPLFDPRAYIRYIMALGMTKGTYPPTDYAPASIKQREIQIAQRIKRWRA